MHEDAFVRELIGHLADLVSAVEGVGVELEGIREALEGKRSDGASSASPDVPEWVNGEGE